MAAYDIINWTTATVSWPTLVEDRFWIANRAYSFDGVDDYIRVTTPNYQFWWTNIISINIWAKPDITAAFKMLWTYRSATAVSVFVSFEGSQFSFSKYTSTVQTKVITTTNPVSTSEYKMYTAVYNWSTVSLYINWALSISSSVTWNMDTISWGWWDWWNNTWVSAHYFDWKINETILSNRALSADEVKELYNLSFKRYLYPFKKTLPLNLMDWLQLWLTWDNNWTTWYDASWNVNNWTKSWTLTQTRNNQHKFTTSWWNNWITVTRNSWLEPSSWTISCWFKTSNTARAQVLLWINNVINTDRNWYVLWISTTTGTVNLDIWNASAWLQNIGTVNFCDWKWHLATWTWDWSNLKVYIDWKLHKSVTQTIAIAYNSSDIKIWFDSTNATRYLTWDYTNDMIWNRALSPIEIQQLYYSQFIL